MPGTQQMRNIDSLPLSSFTAFCLITQLFLQRSGPVKATKSCTIQFIALRQSGICPKVIHSATFLPGTESESRLPVPPQGLEWLVFTYARGQVGGCVTHCTQPLSILLNSLPELITSWCVWMHTSSPPLFIV